MAPKSSSRIFGHRDGFTADSVMLINDVTFKNPLFNLGLLAYLLKKAGAPFDTTLGAWIANKTNRTWGITLASTLVAVSALRRLSDHLSRLARNHGVLDGKWEWSKEIVLVTGAASGIGQRVSQMLCERGITVVGWDVQPLRYPQPRGMHFYKVDLQDPDSVKAVADKVRQEVGHPTVLFNNAGIGNGSLILEADTKHVNSIIGVNSISHYWTVQQFLPNMIANDHGHVIVTASMASYVSPTGLSAYGMSKAAAKAFHYTLSQEIKHVYKAPHVRTSMINPLWTATPLLEPHSASAAANKSNKGLRTLHVDSVAERIVDVIISGESQHLCIPRASTIGSALRGLPDWLHYGLLDDNAKTMTKFDSHEQFTQQYLSRQK